MDGPLLRMSHFCAANNHPRLIAEQIDDELSSVEFEMVDITNLKHEKAGHVHAAKLEFIDDNTLNITFKYLMNDTESIELIQLKRVIQ